MKLLYEFPPEIQNMFIEFHLNRGKLVGRTEGSFGEIFFFGESGQRSAAKCPRISRFGNPTNARAALEKAIYEIDNTRRYQRYPGVHLSHPLIAHWQF